MEMLALFENPNLQIGRYFEHQSFDQFGGLFPKYNCVLPSSIRAHPVEGKALPLSLFCASHRKGSVVGPSFTGMERLTISLPRTGRFSSGYW
jgi:hypothetical protein